MAARTTARPLSPLLLATDLDGTFAGGSGQDRHELYERLARRSRCSLCYVTGRHLESARALRDTCELPEPDVYITDVGATVVPGARCDRDGFPDHELLARWPGAAAIRPRLAQLAHLLEPQRLPTERRLSYTVPEGVALGDALAAVREAVAGLDVEVIGSAGTYVDVLPGGVDKGSTLRRVVTWLGADPDSVVVAGDSLNDLALFHAGFHGIVVGNAEPGLREAAGDLARVYRAERDGAGGVHEGLRHFGFLGG